MSRLSFWCSVRLLDNMFTEVSMLMSRRLLVSALAQGLKTIYRFGLALVERWRRANSLFSGEYVTRDLDDDRM